MYIHAYFLVQLLLFCVHVSLIKVIILLNYSILLDNSYFLEYYTD